MRPPPTWLLPGLLATAAVALFAASPALAGSDRVWAAGPLTAYDPALAGATARLDVEYDAAGDTHLRLAGVRRQRQPWQFAPTWRAGSVVLHALLPVERQGDPVVGAPLACLEVPF